MSKTVTCPRGHSWDASEADLECPVCSQSYAVPPPPKGRGLVPEGLWDLFDEKSAAPHGPRRPPRVTGYQILAELGRGGMGIVWKARQVALKRTVALKQILAGAHFDPEHLARQRTEAEAAARLQHPNIVQIHEVVEQDGQSYLALEYVAGGSLLAKLAGGPLPPRQSAALVAKLARAMAYAHSQGVIHRDLKPANVLLTGVGQVSSLVAPEEDKRPRLTYEVEPKITDFGLAKQLDADAGHTKTGAILGTPSYMAPEQAAGHGNDVGILTDVYSIGAILYECLTGRPPFRAATTLETLEQVRSEDPVSPSRLQPGMPRDVQTICLKCLQKLPSHRYASAADLADDLERFLASEPIRARPVSAVEWAWKWARRRPATAALAAAALLGVLLIVTGLLWHQRVMREEVERANRNEAEARRQQAAAMDNFRKGYETLETIFRHLDDDRFRVQDDRAKRFNKEIAEATLRFYNEVLRGTDADDPDMRLNLGLVRMYAARIHRLLDHPAAADAEHRAAEKALSRLVNDHPDRPDYRAEWAYTNYTFGRFLAQNTPEGERRQEGGRRLRLAADQARLVADPRLGSERARFVLGLALNDLVWQGFGREVEAEEAIAVWSALVVDFPDNRSYRSRLVGALRRLASMRLEAARVTDAEALAGRAEEALRPVFEEPREFFDIFGLRDLALLNKDIGWSLRDKRPADALKWFDRGVLALDRAIDFEPSFNDGQLTLNMFHYTRGDLLEVLGRPEESLAAWDRAVEVVQRHPQHRWYSDWCRVERVRRLFTFGHRTRADEEINSLMTNALLDRAHLYRLAYLLCNAVAEVARETRIPLPVRQKEQDRLEGIAVAALRRCDEAGLFDDPKHLKELNTLAQFLALSGRADFQALLADQARRKK